jgi:hypothetical protein
VKKIIDYKKVVFIIMLISLLIPSEGCKKAIKVSLKSTPSEATVYIDSQLVGKTPFEVNLNPGEHLVEIEKENYINLREKVEVSLFGRKKFNFELKRIPFLFSKKFDGDISIIKGFNDRVYSVINESTILILNSKDGGLISKIDLKGLGRKNLPCKETIEEEIKLEGTQKLSPKEIVNLYLNTEAYLLKSNCLEVFEKREVEVKEILKSIFFDQKLIEDKLTELKLNFLEMSWVNDMSDSSEFKSFPRFYGEYEKNELTCFYVEDLVLKKFEVEEIDFPFEEIPLEWTVLGKYIPGVWLSAIQKIDTILLKKVDGRWFIVDINGGCKGGPEQEPRDSLFCLSPLGDFPNPPKIKDMIPLPPDIERDFERSHETTSKQGGCSNVRDIKVFNERLFIQTNCNLLILDAKLNLVSKYLSYLPLNSSFAVGITFLSKDLKKFNISYLDLNKGVTKWSREFNGNSLFFVASDDANLYFLQIYENHLSLVEMDSKTGYTTSRKEILKVDESYKNINLAHQTFLLSKDKLFFFKDKEVFLVDLKGNILWKTLLNKPIISLWATENYLGICSDTSILILDSKDGKLLKEIKSRGKPEKIYILEDFLFYSEELDGLHFLHCLDFKKDERMFVLKAYNENFIILQDNLLFFQVDKDELSCINLNFIKEGK